MSIGSSAASSRIPAPDEFFLEPEGVVGVAAGPGDVLAHHHREPRRRRPRLGEQRGQAAVAGDADVELVVSGAVPALLEVQAAGLDVPEMRGDEPPVRQPVLHLAELAAQRRGRVLQDQGGGSSQERHRDRGRPVPVTVRDGPRRGTDAGTGTVVNVIRGSFPAGCISCLLFYLSHAANSNVSRESFRRISRLPPVVHGRGLLVSAAQVRRLMMAWFCISSSASRFFSGDDFHVPGGFSPAGFLGGIDDGWPAAESAAVLMRCPFGVRADGALPSRAGGWCGAWSGASFDRCRVFCRRASGCQGGAPGTEHRASGAQ